MVNATVPQKSPHSKDLARVTATDCIYEDAFAENNFLRKLGRFPAGPNHRRRSPPDGTPAYMAHLWQRPLLTAAQEMYLFRRFNYARYRAGRAERSRDATKWCREADQARNHLVEANLRLVVSLARRYAQREANQFEEWVAIGNDALIRAVELFDHRRGFRFSTYAYRAVQRSIFSALRREQRAARDHGCENPDQLDRIEKDASESIWQELKAAEAKVVADEMLALLDDRERQIVMARFGIRRSQQGASFSLIANEVGLSTTRVLQLFNQIKQKLRETVRRPRTA